MSDQERYIQSLERENAYLKIKQHGVRLLLEEAYSMASADYVDTDSVMPEERQDGPDEDLRRKNKVLLNSIYGIMMADPEPEPVVLTRDDLVKALYMCGHSAGCEGNDCPMCQSERDNCYNDIRLLAAYMLEHSLGGLSQKEIEEVLSDAE